MNDMTIGSITGSPRAAAESWLATFNAALAAGDADAAAKLFAATSFWRDLISFTWNIKTVENPDGVRDMLRATLPGLGAVHFSLAEDPTQTGDIVDAWLNFDTAAGRGEGHLRLRDGLAWTFLTSLTELKGFEEPSGARRPMGAEHGVSRDRKTWSERRETEARTLGTETQPYVLVIGGGQGGIALGARLR
jgi:putative flavoprotein involved in K+ transport